MATSALAVVQTPIEPANLPVARSIYSVPVLSIDPAGGLRPLDPAWVEALAALMAARGQKEPIKVYARRDQPGFSMIAGRHRLAAARLLGWTVIDADVQDASALERRSDEISENLFKLGLSPLDRAAFVAEQIAVEKARAGVDETASPQSVAATARWSDRIGAEADDACAKIAHAYGFTDQMAEKVGLSRRAIYLDLELHRGIRPDVADAIRTLPVAGNASQLRALARLSEAEQREVAALIVQGTAKGVTDALGTLKQKPVKSTAQKAVSAILGNWSRLSAGEQKALLKQLALPKGVALTIDGAPVEAAR